MKVVEIIKNVKQTVMMSIIITIKKIIIVRIVSSLIRKKRLAIIL